MKVLWSLDAHYQYLYYCRLSENLQGGFFQKIRAVVLPFLHSGAYYLPDLELFHDDEFTSKLSKVHFSDFTIVDPGIYELVKQKFPENLLVTDPEVEFDKAMFQKAQEKLSDYLVFLFQTIKEPETIIIIPTKFGTNGAFYESDDKKTFYITYRLDFGWQNIVQGILGRFVSSSYQVNIDDPEQWSKRQTIIDFLAENTRIRELFGDKRVIKTIDFLHSYKGALYNESAEYFKKLGFPIESCFKVSGETIFYNGTTILHLEAREILTLKQLILKRNVIVTFDDLAQLYWGEKWLEKFSFTSISKVIETLRKKLTQNNVPNRFIITVRKKGYMLYD